jgi:hypothetical protein
LHGIIALGPAPVSVVLVDARPGRRRERACSLPAASAAWFCARERPVMVGGVLGLQAVAWSLRGSARGEPAAAVLTSWQDVVCI